MNRQALIQQILSKQSFLCIGLDTDITKIPQHLLKEKDPIFEFNKQIIDATHDLCVSYKLNTAFYESMGLKGWEAMQKTLEYIPKEQFTIADAKRGDIGNTSAMYAKAFFENMDFDSVTVAPYMGEDSVKPFLTFENKWVILLALTSNKGADDFQFFKQDEEFLFEKVLKTSKEWGNDEQLMYVVGATRPQMLEAIRKIVPSSFLLVPGVGAQGGSLAEVCKYGMNEDVGLLINSSRAIIYAGNDKNFVQKSRNEAEKIQKEMSILLSNK
ncbi:MAG: orotidine-5'-phosphate decarboxylase [Flavobacteriales bacterium]|jgi:orotidine-5'-phosphate decarboxylase|nr:orotidine-5'-phosphate decarboxylase [Flavobacteriales bacterium]MCW8913717.1 orotidine-5'-phosphate decarboxylase [Flavobacteriales bacterium]MCW8937889.1 orotidine-5'-phosphate decarboxylase [Flavobacteriales bacterium]MCW8941326.1 orotidine-5'-phosphate decarboxylase [Flavobacteriales bacterium]MCW8967321.1 orotidine-5'-phosphate decarboxylase [Flavobacteriales bacterium]